MAARKLLAWYRSHARRLPWRREPRDPYHVLVSEFMLQQTQVERVVPRFESFVRRFPSLTALAAASEDEVVAEWSGLGYYRRARMLQRLARKVVERADGLPRTPAELVELPGVGPYTAAAVSSLAFGEEAAVLDGNVMRVGARMLALGIDPRSVEGRHRLESWVLGLMDGESPAEVNEALMELGATVCLPVEPRCCRCPLEPDCTAREINRQQDFPPTRRRRRTVALRWVAACIVTTDGRWLVRQIDTGPILRGLWLPPLLEIGDGVEPSTQAAHLVPFKTSFSSGVADVVRHNITHRRIDVVPVRFDVPYAAVPSETWRWIDPVNPGVPTSSLLAKLVAACDCQSQAVRAGISSS